MLRLTLCLPFVLAGALQADEKPTPKDRETGKASIEGTWVVVRAEDDGKPDDKAKGEKDTFRAGPRRSGIGGCPPSLDCSEHGFIKARASSGGRPSPLPLSPEGRGVGVRGSLTA